jgi:hypothetical protein
MPHHGMDAQGSSRSHFASEEERLHHYDRTRHVRFIDGDNGRSYCQECDEISTGASSPGMDEDATREPAPGMTG